MRAVIVIVLAACTHAPEPAKQQPPPPPPPAIDARSVDAAIDAAPTVDAALPIDALVLAPDAGPSVAHSCPKRFADVARSTCALDDAWKLACKYPDGHCECVIHQPCAGWAGAYEEAKKHPKAEWICTPKVRADGCPGDEPKIGSHCSKAGQKCMFGSCGGQVLSCSSGGWKLDHVMGGPPAAPPHH
jgi:hypothetical protein